MGLCRVVAPLPSCRLPGRGRHGRHISARAVAAHPSFMTAWITLFALTVLFALALRHVALEGTADASRLRRRTAARRAARPDRGTQPPAAALICPVAGRATGLRTAQARWAFRRRRSCSELLASHADNERPGSLVSRGCLVDSGRAAGPLSRRRPRRQPCRPVRSPAVRPEEGAPDQSSPTHPRPPPYRHRCRLDDRERAAGRRHWGGAADGSRRTPGRPSGTVRPGRSDPRQANSGLR